MEKPTPTIKGIFVRSHLRGLKKAKGKAGLDELARRYGKPLVFKSLANIPVAEEIRIIDLIIDILYGGMPAQKRAFEAGRLHFRNFLGTAPAKLLYAESKLSIKAVFLRARLVASYVFKGMKFDAEDMGRQTVKISVRDCAYPLEHFQGFFQEWLAVLGFVGSVGAEAAEGGVFEYLVEWHQP